MTTMNIATEAGFREASAWTKNQLAMLVDGGVWIIPRSMSAVKVVSRKELTAEMDGMKREPGVVAIMRAMGWKITPTKGER